MAAVDGAAAAVEIRRWQQRGFEMLRLVAAVTQNQRWLQGLFGSGRGSSGERRHGHVAGSWLTVCSLVQCLGGIGNNINKGSLVIATFLFALHNVGMTLKPPFVFNPNPIPRVKERGWSRHRACGGGDRRERWAHAAATTAARVKGACSGGAN
ncbi:hypothetical protein OsI_18831 [Oryza sativa Indica Group]|uniref:Uncharacterized protein n=1 Tax=Oryza sativa subsp. indica TaxID=39946 RepID=A2Y1F2_ORYSI|nr:hypothetical protein OsI_18831 [Oryza sativa Indica Group]